MNKQIVLDELLGALKALHELQSNESPIVYSIGNIWAAIKEICGIKVNGALNEKILEYVLETIESCPPIESRFENLISYLTTSKIEMNEDY